ncbi:MAG: hypothetical protein ACT4P6_18185 [Gemmatimonadaceae bacterium]
MYRALLRSAAVVLAVATAALLIHVGREDPRPLTPLLFARALVIGALVHAGLFWAPDARRGWQQVAVAIAMLPSLLILGALVGEGATRVVRGYPIRFLPTVNALGLVAYAAAYVSLARDGWRRLTRRPVEQVD